MAVFGNGYSDISSNREVARIRLNGSNVYEWKRNAPFDDSQYQGSFHRITVIWTLNNQKVTNIKCYVDGNLYAETTTDYQLTLSSVNGISFGAMDNTNIKEWRLKVI